MIFDASFETEKEINMDFDESDQELDMDPLDERTDLFPVRSVDGVFADPTGNVDRSEMWNKVIAAQLEALMASGAFDGEDGFSPIVSAVPISGGVRIMITDAYGTNSIDLMHGKDGYTPQKGKDYSDGADGFSPVVGIEEIENGYRVTFTDAKGSRFINIMNGEDGDPGYTPQKGIDYKDGEDGYTPKKGVDYTDGKDGEDGFSPTVTINAIAGGTRVTITDKNGSKTFDVMNGAGSGDVTSAMLTAAISGHNMASDAHNDIRNLIPKTAADIGADETGTASNAVSVHNTNEDAHNDIRLLITGLAERVNTIANSDDVDLDQMKEVVAYIKANRSLIEGITTNKINYTDIINNLTTNVANKPLSAAQGVALKALIDAIVVPTKPSDIGAQPAGNYLTSFTETDPTVHSWAKAANKPSYSASEVGADPSGTASSAVSSHNADTSAHSDIRTALNKKANDYSLEIYNGTGGNPKPVRFLTVGYDTCNSENGVVIKIGMVSGHGNGSSYAFLEDVIVKVNYQGGVSVDNFKYYGADAGTYDGAARQYGDIFWVNDTTNKLVTFYVLMGQYARVNSTPYKRLTYSTGGTITQPTSNAVYSSGDKVWANNSEIALMSDIPSWARQESKPAYTASEVGARPNTWTPSAAEVGALPLAGGTLLGTLDFSKSDSWILPYLLAFKNASGTAAQYPYTGFYQWGDEWQVNARDANNVFVHNILAINLASKVANFSAVPTVNGAKIALLDNVTGIENRLSILENSVVSVYSGVDAPASTLGKDGDIYLVTE